MISISKLPNYLRNISSPSNLASSFNWSLNSTDFEDPMIMGYVSKFLKGSMHCSSPGGGGDGDFDGTFSARPKERGKFMIPGVYVA